MAQFLPEDFRLNQGKARGLIILIILDYGLIMEMSTDLISGIILQIFLLIKKIHTDILFIRGILKAESGKEGILEVTLNWEDNKGNILLTENTRYIFSGD